MGVARLSGTSLFLFLFFFLGTPELEDYNLGSWLLKSQLSFKLSPFYVRISFLFIFKWTEFASIWSLCIYMWISFTLYCLVNTMLYIFGYIFLLYNSSSSCYFWIFVLPDFLCSFIFFWSSNEIDDKFSRSNLSVF